MNTCKDCRHWGLPNETSTQQRSCTRYPPNALPVPASGGVSLMTFFPSAQAGHYCGEYFRKPENAK